MYDSNAVLQAAVTKTATFTGAAFDLKTMTPLRGLKGRLRVTAVDGTTPTLDVKIQESADDTTYNDLVVFDRLTAAGIGFETISTRQRYIRALATIGGTLPSFAYSVELGIAEP
jgi:hypothetical protein